MIEVVRAIISSPNVLGPINSFAAVGCRKFGWKHPDRGKLFVIFSFIEIKQPNLAKLCRMRTRINPVNFVRILQVTRPLGAIILVKSFFTVLEAVNPTPEPITVKFGREERSPPTCQISAWSVQHVDPTGEKNKNRHVSKNNTGRAALRADPAGNNNNAFVKRRRVRRYRQR